MNIKYSDDFINSFVRFYTAKHTVKQTADKFNISINQVNYLVKRYKLSNGRTIEDINAEKARKSADAQVVKTSEKLRIKLKSFGFELIQYNGGEKAAIIKCLKCGEVLSRNGRHLVKAGASCPRCADRLRTEKQKAQDEEKARRAAERANKNPSGLSYYQRQREKRLDEMHICKICGEPYRVRDYIKSAGLITYSNIGVCSVTCFKIEKREQDRNKRKKYREQGKRHFIKHYTRAKRLGLPAEEGITLKKLIERDGLICALCGLPCFYGGDFRADLYPSIDHIIPFGNDPEKRGGHTWRNVQVAHRLCNSNKRDRVGAEWHNTP